MSNWFYDTSIGAAIGAARCCSFVGGGFGLLVVSYGQTRWVKNLRGSGRRGVIPYVHRRTELYCTSLPYLNLFFFLTDFREVAPTRAFYNLKSDSYNES
jgi:hypothetical protein